MNKTVLTPIYQDTINCEVKKWSWTKLYRLEWQKSIYLQRDWQQNSDIPWDMKDDCDLPRGKLTMTRFSPSDWSLDSRDNNAAQVSLAEITESFLCLTPLKSEKSNSNDGMRLLWAASATKVNYTSGRQPDTSNLLRCMTHLRRL